ncbi:hypothetical protein [Halapricum sp. CBA1109]|uniref:hypothetical protein n=1 Tax=Halapricum sp. CBA1109 TaxID=2668068 RepID=UPI001E40F143|nr:hypothetical protein [Halapricum sp. CBA1109]
MDCDAAATTPFNSVSVQERTMTETAAATDGDDSYGGIFGAFPYAFRASESRLFRSYAVVGGLAALAIAVTFLLALVNLVGSTASAGAGVFTFSRSFYIVVALAVVVPIIAPVLSVARRHRRGTGSSPSRYDFGLAAVGYVYLGSLYVLLVASAPSGLRRDPEGSGVTASVVEFLYGLDPIYGLVPPAAVALVMYLLHRVLR